MALFLPPSCLFLAPNPSIQPLPLTVNVSLPLFHLYLVRGSHCETKGQQTIHHKCHWPLAYWTHTHTHARTHTRTRTRTRTHTLTHTGLMCLLFVPPGWSQADPGWAQSQICDGPQQREWDAMMCVFFKWEMQFWHRNVFLTVSIQLSAFITEIK